MYARSFTGIEIIHLKEELATSQKKLDRYAHLIATLSDELDHLRNNICHSCKTRLVSNNVSVPTPGSSYSYGSTGTATGLPSLWGHAFQHPRPPTDTPNSPAAPQNNKIASRPLPPAPRVLAFPYTASPFRSISGSDSNTGIVYSKPKVEPPMWSVEYDPEAKRVLDLHLAKVIKYNASVFCVEIDPDGHRVAVGLSEGPTYLTELKTGSNICALVDRYEKADYRVGVFCLQFSPDGQILATGTYDGKIKIWDIAQKRMRAMFKKHSDKIESIVFSNNGRYLVSASHDRSVRIWNVRDRSTKVIPVIWGTSCFFSVVFSPDGRYIAGGNFDKSLWIWDSRKYTLVAKWLGHRDSVRRIEFSPDGKSLISGSDDGTVKCWDMTSLGTGLEPRSFREFRAASKYTPVRSVAFFPVNSQWIITSSADCTARVWDTESGVCYLTMHGHANWVRGTAVSQTHNLLVTASDDGRVVFWKYKVL